MWNTQSIVKRIDKSKWKLMEKPQKQALLLQMHLWFAIYYMIKLVTSKFTTQQQINLLLSFSRDNAHMFFPMNSDDIIEMYFRVKPLIPLLLHINYKNKPSDPKDFMNYLKNNSYFQYMDNGTKYYNMIGGYLFMLTSRGERPIRGVDVENFLAKMDGVISKMNYMPTAGPSEGGSDPLNGFSLLYFLLRNKPTDALFYATPYMSSFTNPFNLGRGAGYTYTNLLSLWKDYQAELNKIDKKKMLEEQFLADYRAFANKYGNKDAAKEAEYKAYVNQVEQYKVDNKVDHELDAIYAKMKKPEPKTNLDQAASIADYIGIGTMFS